MVFAPLPTRSMRLPVVHELSYARDSAASLICLGRAEFCVRGECLATHAPERRGLRPAMTGHVAHPAARDELREAGQALGFRLA
jgi:hypothetical protein